MTVETLQIIACALLVAVAIVSPLCNALFRRPKTTINDAVPTEWPPLSVVITVHDNAPEIERNLPHILQQQYEGDFEVIVVDESSTDDSDDVLKRLKSQFHHLYTTYIPSSSHYVSRRKLALTVGIKAAHHEWIVLTDIDCCPESGKWLSSIASHTADSVDLVLGYTGYHRPTPAYWRYDRLLTACYQFRRACRGTAYRYEGHNLMMRKSIFMSHNGFLSNLKYLRGEYDFIVNEQATPHRTAVASEREARVRQDFPTNKAWSYAHLYYLESRRHMRRGFFNRFLFNTDQLMLHIGWLLPTAAIALAAITEQWLILGVAIAAFVYTLLARIIIFFQACQQMGETIALWKAPWLELRTVWQNAFFLLRYRMADKYDFIRR